MTPTALTHLLPADEQYSPASGGAIATVTNDITRALLAEGHDVRVVSPAISAAVYADGTLVRIPRRSLASRALGKAQRVFRIGEWWEVFDHYRRQALPRVETRDVIVHNDARLAAMAADRGHRVALWLHNLLPEADGDALRRGDRAGVQFICVSEYVRQWTADTYGLTAANTHVIHNVVDNDRFAPPDSWRPANRLRVVTHGRIAPNKGQVLAAQAVTLARSHGALVDLTVLGDVRTFGISDAESQAYGDQLRRALAECGGTWHSHVPHGDVARYLGAADVALALPITPEPFSLAALEGMACGCATIAVPLGGLAEVVDDAALLAKPNPESVAAHLESLAADPGAVQHWRSRALERSRAFAFPGTLTDVVRILQRR